MKKNINLFLFYSNVDRVNDILQNIKKWGTYGIVILIILFTSSLAGYIYLINEKNNLEKEDQRLQSYIQDNTEFQKDLSYFINKYNLLKTYLADDAEAYRYYSLLAEIIQKIDPAIVIEDFTVNNEQSMTVNLIFQSEDRALNFIETMEESALLDYFTALNVSGFDVLEQAEGHKLTLEGIFKPINETR